MEEALYYLTVATGVSMAWMLATGHRPRGETPLDGALQLAAIVATSGAAYALWRGALLRAGVFSLAYGLLACLLWSVLRDWNSRGPTFLAAFGAAQAVFLIRIGLAIAFGGLSAGMVAVSLVLFAAELVVVALTAYFAFEVLDVMCRVRWRRFSPPYTGPNDNWPKVSIHVPAHSEPPDMVIQTLAALRRLDYPNYEVIMIDDNTDDDDLWRPVVRFCREAGFKVFHLKDYHGFKSGALNFALTQAASDVEVIAVVDSDYCVRPNFLRETIPYFRDPQVAFVQTPQAFRNDRANRFAYGSALAQRFFFEISMRSRNERNAIIFCGTMGLIRRRALERVGGWSEWCITEDAETSLRLLRRGYTGIYINHPYGYGILPTSFGDTKKQRFRWAFGGMQILRRYAPELLPLPVRGPASSLTPAQRITYLMGLLGWVNDLLVLIFTGFLLLTAFSLGRGWTLPVRQLAEWILLVPVLSITTGTLRVAWALRHATGCSWRDGLGAFGSMLSFSWTVARACASALVRSRGTFLRTPKFSVEADVTRALRTASWEAALGILLVAAIPVVLNVRANWEGLLLAAILAWHAVIYLSALRSALIEVVPVDEATGPLAGAQAGA